MAEAIRRQRNPVDALFFLGDGVRDAESVERGISQLFLVRGNCDFLASDLPEEELLRFEGHTILLTHGHRYGVKSGVGALIRYAAERDADLVLFGHTHTPASETVPAGETVGGKILSRPMILFNPGSIGAGSFGTLTLRGENVLFAHGRVGY